MMDNGASGYILKNATHEELMEAVETVVKGKTFLSNESAAMLKKQDNTIPVITFREREVLELVARSA